MVQVVPALFGPGGVIGGAERYALELSKAMARRVPTTLVILRGATKLAAKLVVTAKTVRAEVNGQMIGQVELQERPVKLSLYVNGTPARFEAGKTAYPASSSS